MLQVVQIKRTGEIKVVEVPEPALPSGFVLVANGASAISVGTESMTVSTGKKSLVGMARERPDQVKIVLDTLVQQGLGPTMRKVEERLGQFTPLGYSSAGRVLEVADGVSDVAVGERVACAGAQWAFHAEVVAVPKNLVARVPDGVPLEHAAFATVGAISLHAVHRAGVVGGDTVAVIGLGLLGQVTLSILSAYGMNAVGFETNAERVRLARSRGFAAFGVDDEAGLGAARASGRGGADAVIVTANDKTGAAAALAGEAARDKARVVFVGMSKMELLWETYYHKELEVALSRSYGPGRYDRSFEDKGIAYPVGFVPWTERRNLEEFLALVARDAVPVDELITHRFPVADAPNAYATITEGKEPFLGVLLTYGEPRRARAVTLAEPRRRGKRVALIGAGSYASTMLLPFLKRRRDVTLASVATVRGHSAASTASRSNFETATTDADAVIADPSINAVVIATRHDTHASLTARALAAGKAVFVEKPLAVTVEGLREVARALREDSLLVVGFNRRYSPLALALRSHFERTSPLEVLYRVNAGPLPADSWYLDDAEGGGRLLGEVPHFVDFITFLTRSLPVRVFAAGASGGGLRSDENVSVTVTTADGGVGTVFYTANGNKRMPKERVEVFGGGVSATLDNFSRLKVFGAPLATRARLGADKGQLQEVNAFVSSLSSGVPPVPHEETLAVSLASLCCLRSLKRGAPVEVFLDELYGDREA